MTFRKALFWIHLGAGIAAGLVIAVMAFTGAALAFEHELVAWAERDLRRVVLPAASSPRLSLETLRQRFKTAEPNARNVTITLSKDPEAAVAFNSGRDAVWYVNPYSGEIRVPTTRRMHAFMESMTDWHRWLSLAEGRRDIGRAITGATNVAFLLLCLTGVVLWWPRKWSWRGLKAISIPSLRLGGKTRDFNWHNSLGLWTAPILIALTATAMPISYRWASNLIYRSVGEEPPPPQGAANVSVPLPKIEKLEPDARPVPLSVVFDRVQAGFPHWEQMVFRTGGGKREGSTEGRPAGPGPLSVTVREPSAWPRTATTTLTVHPFSGEIIQRTSFSDLSLGRRIRTWTRFLHTGQALGWWGQFLAGIASLGALVMVYTGVALSWRRFFSAQRTAS